MIVTSVETGWEIVYQSAHALLAGQLATQLKQLPKIRYWSETLAAIVDHDDHKESFGKNVYLTALGAPKDFTQFKFSARERFDEVQRRVDSGFRKHRWIGLLAARHAEELYRNVRVAKKLSELINSETARRAGLLHDLRASDEALEAAYAVVQWCDRMSLILCQNALPAMHRRVEIALLERVRHEVWKNEDGNVSVEPWPFCSESFEVQVEVRTVQQLTFTTDRELERRLRECAVEARCWTFHKS